MLHKTLIVLAVGVTLGCVPLATIASAAGHPGHGSSGHATAGRSMAGRAAVGSVHGGRATARYARGGYARSGGGYYGGGPIYDSCAGYGPGYGPGYGYGYGGCPGYGVPLVGGVINGIFGGYGY